MCKLWERKKERESKGFALGSRKKEKMGFCGSSLCLIFSSCFWLIEDPKAMFLFLFECLEVGDFFLRIIEEDWRRKYENKCFFKGLWAFTNPKILFKASKYTLLYLWDPILYPFHISFSEIFCLDKCPVVFPFRFSILKILVYCSVFYLVICFAISCNHILHCIFIWFCSIDLYNGIGKVWFPN